MIYIEKVDQIWPFSIKINLKSNFLIFFTICWNRFRRDDSKSNNKFGSKKSIKRRLESDLKQILALGWLNCISLPLAAHFDNRKSCQLLLRYWQKIPICCLMYSFETERLEKLGTTLEYTLPISKKHFNLFLLWHFKTHSKN